MRARVADRTSLATLATALLVGGAGWLSVWAAPSRVALLLALAFVPYAALVAMPRHDARTARLAWLCAAAVCLLWVPLTPPLSDDVFRFLWDGRVLRHGIDPYRYAPDDPALASLRDAAWQHVNHRYIPTIYPPLSQLMFAGLGALWHSPGVMKVAAGGVLLGLGAALLRDGRPRAATLLLLNPLALSESALNGHLDIAVGGALWLAVRAIEDARSTRAIAWMGMATGLKGVGLLFTPLLGRRRRGLAAIGAAVCLAVLAPQAWPRADDGQLSGAAHYARRWRGNDGGFALVEAGMHAALYQLADEPDRARGHIRLPQLEWLLEQVRDTSLDPWRGALSEKKWVPDRTDFELGFLAGQLTRVAVVSLVALAAAVVLWRQPAPAPAGRLLLLGTLWFAPQVHPWYLLWVLPLECHLGGLAALVWSALALGAYAPLDLWERERIWHESAMIRSLEFAAVLLVLACERRLQGASLKYQPPTNSVVPPLAKPDRRAPF